ncbi:MAG: 2-oxoacid:acceptor oxidoreductase subunit alpha [candidate division WOR-3 bacterium]
MPWKRVKSPIKPGRYFVQGDEAVADGAFCAGMRFYAGYPITPASEIITRVLDRFEESGEGVYFQGEDEIASIAACIGASWTGVKAMTATSGPGFDLMIENLGYAIFTETPLVIVDVQRAGPSTGQAARPSQADYHQARYGTHGDYEIIVLSPWSCQELFEFGIKAFNLSERYRVPVIILTDEAVGHLREPIIIPEEIDIFDREHDPDSPPFSFDERDATPMPLIGDGKALLITGSTHTEYGKRITQDAEVHRRLVKHLIGKIKNNISDIFETQEEFIEESEIVIASYGISARSAYEAVKRLRSKGIKAGFFRLKVLWPFWDRYVREALSGVKKIFVPEMNAGHLAKELERVLNADIVPITELGTEVIKPEVIVKIVEENI